MEKHRPSICCAKCAACHGVYMSVFVINAGVSVQVCTYSPGAYVVASIDSKLAAESRLSGPVSNDFGSLILRAFVQAVALQLAHPGVVRIHGSTWHKSGRSCMRVGGVHDNSAISFKQTCTGKRRIAGIVQHGDNTNGRSRATHAHKSA